MPQIMSHHKIGETFGNFKNIIQNKSSLVLQNCGNKYIWQE